MFQSLLIKKVQRLQKLTPIILLIGLLVGFSARLGPAGTSTRAACTAAAVSAATTSITGIAAVSARMRVPLPFDL